MQRSGALANFVRAIYQDKQGRIWLATKEKRIVICDQELNVLGNLAPDGTLVEDAIWPNAIYSISADAENVIWLGSRGSGLYKLTPNAQSTAYEVRNFVYDSANTYSISSNDVYSVIQDKYRNIWIATLGGGVNLLEKSGDDYLFINYNNRIKNYPMGLCSRVRSLNIGPKGVVYAATSNGLLTWNSDFLSADKIKFKHYFRNGSNRTDFRSNEIIDVHVTDGQPSVFWPLLAAD